jgi:hypothetical protein
MPRTGSTPRRDSPVWLVVGIGSPPESSGPQCGAEVVVHGGNEAAGKAPASEPTGRCYSPAAPDGCRGQAAKARSGDAQRRKGRAVAAIRRSRITRKRREASARTGGATGGDGVEAAERTWGLGAGGEAREASGAWTEAQDVPTLLNADPLGLGRADIEWNGPNSRIFSQNKTRVTGVRWRRRRWRRRSRTVRPEPRRLPKKIHGALEPLHVRLRGDQYVTRVASTVLVRWENISSIVEKISEAILHTLIKWLRYFCAQPKQCSTYWI